MQEQAEYEVWKLVENQGRCYASTDCIQGVSLAGYLKYHPIIPRELLLRWMKEIPRELEKFHRCRGNPCFQYVNPFSFIISSEETIYLLNLQSEKQKELLKMMRRRDVRESFLKEDNLYYQRISIPDDIYSLGRMYQYVFAVVDTVPQIRRKDRRKLRKIIAGCLNQEPDRETGKKFKKQYQNFQEISDQFSNIQNEKKIKFKKRLWLPVGAATLACLFIGGVWALSRSVGLKNKPLKNEKQKYAKYQETDSQVNLSKYQGEKEDVLETKFKYDLGFLYFLDLEDYEKSREVFAEISKTDALGSAYEKFSAYLASKEELEEQELEELLGQIEEQIPDQEDYRYYYSLVRGYRILTTDSAKERLIEAGEHCLKLEGWKEKTGEGQKEILTGLADAYEQILQIEEAVRVYEEVLDLEEEDEQREQIYKKLVYLYEKNNNQEKAWEICEQGIKELEKSSALRIQFIRMQCENTSTDREICAQTIQKYLKEVPEIVSSEEFKKLQEIYDIRMEGGNIWVGR